MRILGIDPGLVISGYGVIDCQRRHMSYVEAGVIRTNHKRQISFRLKTLHDSLCGIIKEFEPNVIVLEKLYSHYRHPSTAILMGHARGVICLASGVFDIPLVNIASTRIKKSVMSHGHGSKTQIQHMVQYRLNLKSLPEPHDAADALAVAISYGLTNRAREREAVKA